ncbi:signal peptidase I [Rhodococcus sp. Q]|uniref:signal peptidase I n=1 Tax=Rhodococcus sp. Q TaxID=2502252 RepID=UPI001BB17BD3|nr:signal peptidase I [Rhodococcus sp. Q]
MTNHENAPASGRSRGREIALNVGAIAGLICVLAAAASFLFGIKPLVFRSGSMSPDIPTGALALAKATPASDLAVGDVVSVENDQGVRITHRIQEVVSTDGTNSVLILKGDANRDADISPYTVSEADLVFFSVPGLGYAVSWLSSPAAIFLGGALVGGVMVLAFGPASKRKDDNDSDSDVDPGRGGPGAHEAVEHPAAHAHSGFDAPTEQFRAPHLALRRRIPARTMMAAGALGLTAMVGMTAGTSAAFTDSADAATSFASRSSLVPAPKYLGCTTASGNSGQTLRWEHLGPGYTYQVQLINAYSSTVAPSIPANKGDTVTLNISTYNNIYKTAATSYVEVRTIRNGVTGTSWIGEKIYSSTIWTAWCNGVHQGGSDQSSLAAPSGGGTDTLAARMAAPAPTTTAAPTTTVDPTTTAGASTTTAEPTTTSATTTTTAPTTTVAPTTTTDAAPTTSAEKSVAATEATTTETTTTEEAAAAAAPSGDLAIANTSTSGKYTATVSGTTAAITDESGAQVFSSAVGKKAIVQWASGADELWIIDGDTLSMVDAATGSVTNVDPSSDQVPAEIAVLVTN